MQQCVYVKFPKRAQISSPVVSLSDVCQLYCPDQQAQKKLEQLQLIKLNPKRKQEKYMMSFLRVIQVIQKEFPDMDIQNIGETDFVLYYQENPAGAKLPDVLEWAKTCLVCLILFFGAAFTIMAFNTDVDIPKLFSQLYHLAGVSSSAGVLELCYSLGLPIGIIVFYDHFWPVIRRKDPTPIEVQMRIYEEDMNNVLIQNAAMEGRVISYKRD